MTILQTVTVKKHERAMLLRQGDFERILPPGRHWLVGPKGRWQVERFVPDAVEFTHPLADHLMAHEPQAVAEAFVRVELSEWQVGLRFENDVLVEVLPPTTRRLYWKGRVDLRVEVIDIAASAEVPAGIASRLVQTQLRPRSVAGLSGVLQVQVPQTGAGILWIDTRPVRLLPPGTYAFWKFNRQVAVELFDLRQQQLDADLFTDEAALAAAGFARVAIGEHEVGLRCENGLLVEVLPPTTRRLFWTGRGQPQVEVIDISASAEVPQRLVASLLQTTQRPRQVAGLAGVLHVQVPQTGVGILRIDGTVERLLDGGAYAFWRFNREVTVEHVDLRLQTLEVTGQEILTRDKVALRLNLSATWRFTDVLQAHQALAKPAEHLYRELQFGLRAAVGTRSLDELLENRTVIDEVVTAQVTERLAGYGLELQGVGVKDIVLPGEMKTILAKVVEAGKAAEANVIRRREETAATRSLLNTARVMEGNPVALRMKELETLERVAERIDRISVVGGLDQVLDGLVKLRG